MSINRYILFFWFVLMALVSGLLMAEYAIFKQQANNLEYLKNEYAQYLNNFKKSVVQQDKSISNENSSEDLKKKGQIVEEPTFLVLNREPTYLKKSALSYAKKHNLTWAMQKMYESDEEIYKLANKKRFKRPRVRHKIASIKSSKYNSINIKNRKEHQLREPIFNWPLNHGQFRLSSVFGPRKKPNGSWGFHTGIDLAAPRGTKVKAVADGVVITACYSPGYGNTIIISHNEKFKTRYAHLDKILVTVGQQVSQGENIGKVGSTGRVRTSKRGGDGSHLHFEVYLNSKHVNPFYFLR